MAISTTSWVGQPKIKGSTESMQMALLTMSMVGLQFCWICEMAYGTPYLLSLGLSKSKLSLVWVAGPLSGLIMQPLIGVISDKCTSKYGRRRPFMAAGTAAVMVCLLVLGWTGEVVGWFVKDAEVRREITIAVAVVDIYVLDFVINIAQSTCRALVVDALPVEKQQLGSAWASRMVGVGHMLMNGIGSLDLQSLLGDFMGDTQFKKVCMISAVAMAVSQGLSCWAVQERVLVADKLRSKEETLLSVLRQIYTTLLHLPDRIQAICWVQFWSWIGWFPFLFYGSTWVGEIYLRHEASADGGDALTDVGRHGSQAMIFFAVISFASSIILPWLIESPDDSEKPAYTPRPPRSLQRVLKDLRAGKPSLLTAWMLGNLIFAVSMIFAPFVQSVRFATLIIALCGIPWAVAGWASGSFMGVEVNRINSSLPLANGHGASYRRLSNEAIELSSNESSPRTLHLRHDSNASAPNNTSTGEMSGVYFGILNIYTTLPQFVGTAISWLVFSILEPGKSPELAKEAHPDELHKKDGLSGIAVCLFIGALCALVAAWATRRLKVD